MRIRQPLRGERGTLLDTGGIRLESGVGVHLGPGGNSRNRSIDVAFVTSDWTLLDTLIAAETVEFEAVCHTIARIVGVRPDEVGLMKACGFSLEFVFPYALRSTGRILLSSSAVAARTATLKQAEMFNSFAMVSHNNVFELVPLGKDGGPQRVQKLISAPILDGDHHTLGVLQVLRKGKTPAEAGGDFTEADVQLVTLITRRIAGAFRKGPD